jgi:hypothetical protein
VRTCEELHQERLDFLALASSARREAMRRKEEGEWTMHIFTVVADPADLKANVIFGAAVEARLREVAARPGPGVAKGGCIGGGGAQAGEEEGEEQVES